MVRSRERRAHGMCSFVFQISIILSLTATACAGSRGVTDVSINGSSDSRGLQWLTPEGQRLLTDFVQKERVPRHCASGPDNCRIELQEFYNSLDGSLGWISDAKPTRQALELIGLLKTAENNGLDSDDYDGPRWDERIARLKGRRSESNLVAFDVALTGSAMRYVSDIRIGRVNPGNFRVESKSNGDRNHLHLSEFMLQMNRSSSLAAAIQATENQFPGYRRAVEALRKYRDLAQRDDGELLPIPSRTIRSGQSYAGVPRLIRLLALVGDLPVTTPTATNAVGQKMFSADLADGVKRFQRRHGLEPSGRLDADTIKEMNTPLSRRVAQLELTVERWRWLPHEFGRPPIMVNIPEFALHAENEKYEPDLSMKVVVGGAYEHQTPVFASELSSVILRPAWEVPSSIQKDELIQHIEKDRNYLVDHSYQVVDKKGEVISDGEVNRDIAKRLNSGELGLRQKPGPENALGLIKFDFPNPYSVYLHGTPSVHAFAKQRRDLSHGCIRVEDPVALAAWILQDKPEWDAAKIDDAASGDTTIRINAPPVPILIVYMTASVTPDGEVHFYRDIYEQDASLETALTSAGTIKTVSAAPTLQRPY